MIRDSDETGFLFALAMKLPLTTRLRQRCRRPMSAVLVAFILLAALCMLFLAFEVVRLPVDKNAFVDKSKVTVLEARLQQLESELKRNREALAKLSGTMEQLHQEEPNQHVVLRPSNRAPYPAFPVSGNTNDTNGPLFLQIAESSCLLGSNSHVDVSISELFEKLPFDNVDGGVWKQGWAITYDEAQWSPTNKLKVFVVPHSHNDPGWLKTFEKYYLEQTQHILKNMASKLSEEPRRSMIWAEVSYLDLFWQKASSAERHAVKKLLDSGQLEIVTGGWVMNDEAVAHYFSITEQLIEGHEWLQNHLQYFPENGWAIDPFGVSPVMAYLLKRMGLSHMLIQRVHFHLKKYLSKHQTLEFYWRQQWDTGNTTDMFCHLMPFYSYDVPHTCGPDPKVCCQFDFKRLPGGKIGCPWKIPPQPITDKNVADRALLLLDQYRKKSQLFRTNVVLVPLGDDFRYDKSVEWDQQFENYQRLFDHMNQRAEWNVQAQFGTLRDYFNAVDAELAAGRASTDVSGESGHSLPSLGGDFFTYADRDDHYWSGYYSSRPLYKNMDRVLASYLRAGEILYSTLLSRRTKPATSDRAAEEELLRRIVKARRNLSLFQHHDAVTGTARDYVVVDYGNRLLDSIIGMQEVIGSVSSSLLTVVPSDGGRADPPVTFDLDDNRASHSSLSTKTLIRLPSKGGSRTVVFHNSHGQRRRELVTLVVSSPWLCMRDLQGADVGPVQVDPVWDGDSVSADRFAVSFVVDVPALGFATYSILAVGDGDGQHAQCYAFSRVTLYNMEASKTFSDMWGMSVGQPFNFTLSTSRISASFSSEGLLHSLSAPGDNGTQLPVSLSFLTYGTTPRQDKSGAYLFLPGEEPARPLLASDPPYRVTRGHLLSEARVFLPRPFVVEHSVQLRESPGADGLGVHVMNVVDISQDGGNHELVMRMETEVASGRDFHTDLNGFQTVQRRTHLGKMPIQSQFYPVGSAAFLQDATTRFTMLSGQPLGGTSLQSGWLEVILDRRLNQDDNRGLQQGVQDNKAAPSAFVLLMERRKPEASAVDVGSHLSLAAHLVSRALLYPVLRMIVVDDGKLPDAGATVPALLPSFSALQQDLPCDVHMLNLRAAVSEKYDGREELSVRNHSLLLLHRLGFDCTVYAPPVGGCQLSDGKINLGSLFGDLYHREVAQTTVTGLYNLETFPISKPLRLYPMELYAYKLFR